MIQVLDKNILVPDLDQTKANLVGRGQETGLTSSLWRVSGLLSRIQYRNRGIFYNLTLVWSTNFSKKKNACFFPEKAHMGRVGVGVGVRVRVRVSVRV